jgi:putrescine transport system substrate-binding protein
MRATITGILLILLSSASFSDDIKTLRILNWGEYIAPAVIADFEQKYHVHIDYTGYYSIEEFSEKLFNPDLHFDVVFAASRIINSLDESSKIVALDNLRLPRLDEIRRDIMQQYQQQDSGKLHAIPYMWGTTGLGVNVALLQKLGIAEYKDSWALLFDPAVRHKAAQCGIALLNERDELFAAALVYLGFSVNSTNPDELAAAGLLLKQSTADASYLHATQYRTDLLNGKVCVAVGYSGNVLADIQGKPELAYFIPREGAAIWIDVMSVSSNTKEPDLAYHFIDFLMQPQNAARNSNYLSFPTAMQSAMPFIDKAIADNPAIYPAAGSNRHLEAMVPQDKAVSRIKHRLWVTAICSGRSWCSIPMTSFF